MGGIPWRFSGQEFSASIARGAGSILDWGTKVLQAVQGGQKKKKKVNTFGVTENTTFARTNSGFKIIYLRISFNIPADHEK